MLIFFQCRRLFNNLCCISVSLLTTKSPTILGLYFSTINSLAVFPRFSTSSGWENANRILSFKCSIDGSAHMWSLKGPDNNKNINKFQ